MARITLTLTITIFSLLVVKAQDLAAVDLYAATEAYTATMPDNVTTVAATTKENAATAALRSMRQPNKPMLFTSAEQVKMVLWSDLEANATVKIHTEQGKKVKEVEQYLYDQKKNEITLHTGDLAPGTYWISFFKDGELLSSRSYTK